MKTLIDLGRHQIGIGKPCFIAAEIGINHNGDMGLARRMIKAAAEAGADGVKFQNYHTEDFLSDHSLKYKYVNRGEEVIVSQFEMFKRCELTAGQLSELKAYCDSYNVSFFSTPTSKLGLRDLINAGGCLVKNGSDYLMHLPLIQAMARSGLPTVLSTGMADEQDIDDAVEAFEAAGGTELVLLHCTSAYPTPDDEVNLRCIQTLASRYNCLVGFSDHTWGVAAAQSAVALGACFVEKHFTLDKNLPGPDHRFSSDPEEFALLVKGIRRVEQQLGSPEILPTQTELKSRNDYRLSCVAASDLPAGHVLSSDDVAFRRPGTGLPPKALPDILGQRLLLPVSLGAPFQQADFDES